MKPISARGFTMLEVLVAILVLSLGLLGLAGLQTVSLRNNTGAAQRTIATQLAYDMADRMRANYASVLAGDYNFANYGVSPGADGRNSAAPAIPPAPAGGQTANCYVPANGCTPQQLAYQDIYDWNQQICAQLPQSAACSATVTTTTAPWGVICIDSTPNDGTPAAPLCDGVAGATYVIKVWWIEDRNSTTIVPKLWATSFVP
jgi:type IV pilus assembly protein PilV